MRISVPVLMAELGLSQAHVYRLLAAGMPRDSLEAALRWREHDRGYKLTKRQRKAKRREELAECRWWAEAYDGMLTPLERGRIEHLNKLAH